MMPGNENFSNISSWLRQFEELATSHEQNVRGRLAEDTLWRTLIFDTAEDCQLASSDFGTRYHEMRHFIGKYPTIEDEVYAWSGTHVGKLLMGMASRCQRRRLAITAGNHVGLVLEKAWPGDLIAVSNGCAMPFMLCADIRCRFRLVGDWYVHGIMYGEAAGEAIRPLRNGGRTYWSEELTPM